MSYTSNCYYSAVAESFFYACSLFEKELASKAIFHTRAKARDKYLNI